MIDIHCHILPSADDGPEILVTSLEMAKIAVSEGITDIIATPHHMNERYENEKQDIITAVNDFNKELQQAAIPLTVHPGQEVRVYGEIFEDYQRDTILTLAETTKYILIEFPYDQVPKYTRQLFYELQLQGLIPIIAHPERNTEIVNSPDLLYDLVKNGALTQLTTSSLTGYFGKRTKHFAEQLIDANLTHFIASDAHSVERRSFRMAEALDYLDEEFGTDVTNIFIKNAEQLLKCENVFRQPPEKIRRKKLLGIF